jgi:uncharacterized protein (TIGR00730 family)
MDDRLDWALIVAFIRLEFPSHQRDLAQKIAAGLAEVVRFKIKQLRPEHTLSEIAHWADEPISAMDLIKILHLAFQVTCDEKTTFRTVVEMIGESQTQRGLTARDYGEPKGTGAESRVTKRICVFTGSREGGRAEYTEAARRMGRELVERGYGLVYGGGKIGLMTVLADSVLEHHGRVTGVIPESLVGKEVAHSGLSDLRIVNSMHERKAVMAELSDGFIAMPGGIGTLEEFFEVLSWAQLGIHNKPCGLLNVCGYYEQIIQFLDYAVAQDFLKSKHRSLLIVGREPGELLDQLEHFIETRATKRFERART